MSEQDRIIAALAPRAAVRSLEAARAFRDTNGFNRLLRAAVAGWLEVFRAAPPELHHLSKDRGGFFLGLLLMAMQAEGPPIPLQLVKRHCHAGGIASPGRVSAFVRFLVQRGYIVQHVDRDGAVLTLSERLAALYRAHLRSDLRALALVTDELAGTSEALDGEAVFDAARWVVIYSSLPAGPSPWHSIAVERLGERSAGMQILWDLILSERDPDPLAACEANVSIAALARRYEVSRPHVRKLLQDCHAEGGLAWVGPGRIAFSPRFVDEATLTWAWIFMGLRATFGAWLEHRSGQNAPLAAHGDPG